MELYFFIFLQIDLLTMKFNIEKYKNKAILLKDKAVAWLKGITFPGFHG